MAGLLAWASVALAALGICFVGLLILRRIQLARRERVRREAERRLRPLAFQLLDGHARNVPRLDPDDSLVLAAMLARYSKQLQGEPRQAIAAYFERSLGVVRERTNLHERRAWRRAAAAYALGDMVSVNAVPALLATLDDSDRDVRAAAARSLGRIADPRAVQPLVGALARGRVPHGIAAHALLGTGGAALGPLRALLKDQDADVRAVALELVGLLGDAGDAELVGERLRDTSAEVRAKAARALGRLGAGEGTAQLRAALDDRIGFVRATAAAALGLIGDRAAVPALLALAREDSFDAAQAAAKALARIDRIALDRAAAEPDAALPLQEAADLAEVRD